MTFKTPAAWVRVALVMFAVGWGANQFSPMLIVYRHALGLSAGEIAGLFAIYAATLIPGLLAGGPLSDRFGRRACVLPFAALSPVATLLLVLGPHSLPLLAAGRALAGLCSGMVIGPATAWIQDLSGGDARSARPAAISGRLRGPRTNSSVATGDRAANGSTHARRPNRSDSGPPASSPGMSVAA